MPMYLMRKYSCCFVVLRKKKVNKTGSGSGWVSASVWALRDCVRIKVGMGRQIFIKRGGGVSGAEPRLPLILRRLALSSPTPPHTALPPPPPSLSPFLPLPPLPLLPLLLSLAFVWLNLVWVWSRANISTCAFIPAESERERESESEGVLFRVRRQRGKKKRSKAFGFWKPSVDSKEPRLAAFQSIAESALLLLSPHARRAYAHTFTHKSATHDRSRRTLTRAQKHSSEKES